MVSAGYDAHEQDPLADCRLVDRDYADLAATVRELGAELGAPVLLCLEGGYNLEALGRSVVATVRALGDSSPPPIADPGPAAPDRERVAAVWPALA